MKVDQLKEKARRFEQKEDWAKALDLYREALQGHDEDEPPDITLYNRVGDIQTRLGQIDGAVEQYERAIELYVEAELPNNAIAICKKVLRNLPDRAIFFLRMGQIRAGQGFLTDARHNFLTYAEMVTAAGDLTLALDALLEFVDLSPEDVDIRIGLAGQLESLARDEEAITQYTEAYRRLILVDRDADAEEIRAKLAEKAPDALLPDPQSIRAGAAVQAAEEPALAGADMGGFSLGGADDAEGAEAEAGAEAGVVEVEPVFGEIDIDGGVEEQADAVEEEVAEELPAFGDALESVVIEEEAEELPGFGDALESAMEDVQAEEVEAEAEEEDDMGLPTFGFDEDVEAGAVDEEEDLGLPTFGFDGEKEEEEEEAVEELPGLGAEAFGEPDHSDRDGKEYVEEAEELPELEVDLEDFSFGGEEEEAEVVAEEEEGMEEGAPAALEDAIEDASFEDALEEVAEVAFVEEPAPVEPEAEPQAESHSEAAARGDMGRAIELVRDLIQSEPDQVEHYQRLVEYAFRTSDQDILIPAYLDLAHCLGRTGAGMKAKAVFQQVLNLSPGHEGAEEGIAELEGKPISKPTAQVASSEEYVDLGSMILGGDEEKTTRWRVTADAPSGDDQADFSRMLSQFKEKVAEHVDADDVAAHHDLGTAYMEMGLLDEAISEYQMALRASPDHLPTHEVMGRCWMEMDKPDMAVRALNRALDADYEIEDELIGIYYLLGRAHQDLGNSGEAVEFYEKVFSLDINFEDVTERLRALR